MFGTLRLLVRWSFYGLLVTITVALVVTRVYSITGTFSILPPNVLGFLFRVLTQDTLWFAAGASLLQGVVRANWTYTARMVKECLWLLVLPSVVIVVVYLSYLWLIVGSVSLGFLLTAALAEATSLLLLTFFYWLIPLVIGTFIGKFMGRLIRRFIGKKLR